jgi:hypothetical protein
MCVCPPFPWSPSYPRQTLTPCVSPAYLCDTPSLDVSITKDELLTMYRQMQTMRRMEMAADALYKAKMIRGFCHLAIGQVSTTRVFWVSVFVPLPSIFVVFHPLFQPLFPQTLTTPPLLTGSGLRGHGTRHRPQR